MTGHLERRPNRAEPCHDRERTPRVKPATRARPFLLLIAGAALLFAACTNAPARGAATPTTPISPVPPLEAGSEPYAAVASRVLPSVVNVTTNVYQASSTGAPEQGEGIGTGFIVRSNGVVVTNCHVVQGASRITVFTSEDEPTRYDARVIGGDCEHDLAVLKVDAQGLPTIRFGASADLRLGQQVVAIGYALALEGGPSVTAGIVSSLDRTIRVQDPQCTVCTNGVRTYSEVIQTDAAINHGNSGGPLVDMAGRVVGINSAGSDSAENIGFAIAIDSVRAAVDSAISDPLRATAYLGISTRSVTADLAFQLDLPVEEGALVLATLANGPAAEAGIREDDVIVEIDGEAIEVAEDLGRVLDALAPGDVVDVRVAGSDGDERTHRVTLGTKPLPTEFLEP
jgi:serine protease Do